MATHRNWTLLVVIVVALALLYPGVTRPVLTLSGTIDKADLVDLGIELLAGDEGETRRRQAVTGLSGLLGFDSVTGELAVYRETRSILGTVQELARTGNAGVAVLIALFSIVVPLVKLGLQLTTVLLRDPHRRARLGRIIGSIGKWSMADVFVMALFVTYLAGSAGGRLGDLMTLQARLEPGFWFFLGYCLFSVASTVLVGSAGDRATVDRGAP